MKKIHLVLVGLVALLAAALLVSCTKTDDKLAARIGGGGLTVKAVKDDYLSISPAARPDLKTIDEKEAFVKDLVAKEILRTEARTSGIAATPEISQIRSNAMSRRAWQAYYEDMVSSKVAVTDKDLQDLYARQKDTYHIGWILLRSRTLAAELAKRIAQGEDFGALAAVYSLDQSRSQNGDIGARTLGTMPPPVEAELVKMSPGQVSGVLPFDTYYFIVKLYEKAEQQQPSFEEAREGLNAIAKASAENARQRELAVQMRKDYELAFNGAAMDLIVAKTNALYQSSTAALGQVPEFTDEELDREMVRWKGGVWKVRNYVESLASLRDFMRPGYGADRDGVESLVSDFATGEFWKAEITNKGYDKRPEVVRAGDRAAEEAMVTMLHDNLVKDVKLDPEKIKTFYEENKAQMMTEPAVRVAVIVSEDSVESAKIYDQLGGGAKFEALAEAKSADRSTAPNGGELMRPIYKQEMEQFPDFQRLVDGMAVGSFSAPVAVPPGFGPAGYMVVKLLERIEAKQMPLEDVQGLLGERVLQMEQDKVFAEWLRSKMEELKVEIYPDALNAVDFAKLKSEGA
jgi:peptidyl-prolyl cis-trans isomerase C